MTTSLTIFERLAAPFDPAQVDWRVGSTTADKSKGMALAYIDARAVMARLDEVCGSGGWQNRYSATVGTTVCEIGINCAGEWIWKADGAGASDVEAEKGALSDAFKRAAVRWGIGRYLYDIASPWVALKAQGKSFVIDDSERPRLHALLSGKPMAQVPASNGARSASTRDISPLEYVNAWKTTIDTFRTVAELDAWDKKNDAALVKLNKDDPELAKDMETFIGMKRKKLAQVAA